MDTGTCTSIPKLNSRIMLAMVAWASVTISFIFMIDKCFPKRNLQLVKSWQAQANSMLNIPAFAREFSQTVLRADRVEVLFRSSSDFWKTRARARNQNRQTRTATIKSRKGSFTTP